MVCGLVCVPNRSQDITSCIHVYDNGGVHLVKMLIVVQKCKCHTHYVIDMGGTIFGCIQTMNILNVNNLTSIALTQGVELTCSRATRLSSS